MSRSKRAVLLASAIVPLLAVSAMAGGDVAYRIAELPRPNSGAFSSAQAEVRKSEILSNVPSPKLARGDVQCCIHIEKDDTVTIYNHILKGLPEYSQLRTNQSIADIVKAVDMIPRDDNPVRLLITSDLQLKRSKVIHSVLKELFVPSTQLLYVVDDGQNGATNVHEPVNSKTNSASPAAGSRS